MILTDSNTASLNGLWDFAFLGAIALDNFDAASITDWSKQPVPAAFDALPDHAGKRGLACYRRTVDIPSGRTAKLSFGAISIWSQVYIDGVLMHENACGYAPIEINVPAADTSRRELLVLVDNRFDFERVPMHEEYFDFYQYGGILRDVGVRIYPADGQAVDFIHVTPLDDYAQGEVHIRVGLVGDIPSPAELSVSFDGAEATPVQVEIDGQEASFTTRVPQPRLWSPQSPELHTVRIDLPGHEPTAGCQTRFGLRKIEARDGKLWLNGQQLTLKGYNRHEWHPNSGPTTPTLQMVADLQYLRDLGCNFVRGSHYPQDQRFLDLCDEMGFLVWEENLGWGQRERTLTSPTFHQQHDKSLRAMMHASHNHPSVIIWGFLNEAGSNEAYSRPIFEQTVATIRQLDSSRLVSFASMFVLKDLNFDLVDLIAINIYPGWYGCEYCEEPLSLIAPHMEKCFAHVSSPELKDKPIIVSEIGAEALYGWREAHNDFYTEEYQAQYLKTACEEALGHERCSGIALWHFSDARTYGGGLSMKRPRTFNNKGTLDEYRRPKAAYRSVREVFHRYPDTPAS